MKSLFKILDNKAFKSELLKGALKALTVEEADAVLQTIFGPEIKNFAKAAFIKNGVLKISCRGSATAQEIRMRQDEILRELNRRTGDESIKEIKIIL